MVWRNVAGAAVTAGPWFASTKEPEANESRKDQVSGDDVIQQPRPHENQDSGRQRDDWLEVRGAEM